MDKETILSEQTADGAQAAGAEDITGAKDAAASLKKFKTPEALLRAYESLEAEFTRKCQKLGELESKLSCISNAENAKAPEQPQFDLTDEKFIEEHILTNKAVTDRIISGYLKELCKSRAPRTIAYDSGIMPLAPLQKPKSIAEAGQLAEKLLKTK